MFDKLKKLVKTALLIIPMFSVSESMDLNLLLSRVISSEFMTISCEMPPEMPPQSRLCAEASEKIMDLSDLNQESCLAIYRGSVKKIAENAIAKIFLKTEKVLELPFPSISTHKSLQGDTYVSLSLDGNMTPHKKAIEAAKTESDKDALVADNENLKEINNFFIYFMSQADDGTKVFIPKLPMFRVEPISRKGCSLTGEAADKFQRDLNATRIWYFLMVLSEKCEICLPIGALREEEGKEIQMYMP